MTTDEVRTGMQRSSYEVSADESPTEAVVRAVASVVGVDPVPGPAGDPELDPLYSVVDPDALDALFESNDGTAAGRVTFHYQGCEVTVSSDGRIEVTRLPTSVDGIAD